MDELYQRLNQAEQKIAAVKNKIARKDLLKMVKTVDAAMIAADQESVECRRLHKETARHKELIKTAGDLITNLEQHLVFAVLLND